MKILLTILTVSFLLCSCNGNKAEKNQTSTDQEIEVSFEKIASAAADMENEIISIEGMVTHVCKHGGQKMFLTDSTQQENLLVRVSESIPEFDVALEGSTVRVTGKLVVSVTEEEALLNDEAKHDESDTVECATEEALKEKSDSDSCTTNITYYLEATTYSEL